MNVLGREVGEVCEDLFRRHPGSEVLEYFVHRDPEPADTGFPAPFTGLHRDVASAVAAGAAWLLTTDKGLLGKMKGDPRIQVADPVDFVRATRETSDEN